MSHALYIETEHAVLLKHLFLAIRCLEKEKENITIFFNKNCIEIGSNTALHSYFIKLNGSSFVKYDNAENDLCFCLNIDEFINFLEISCQYNSVSMFCKKEDVINNNINKMTLCAKNYDLYGEFSRDFNSVNNCFVNNWSTLTNTIEPNYNLEHHNLVTFDTTHLSKTLDRMKCEFIKAICIDNSFIFGDILGSSKICVTGKIINKKNNLNVTHVIELQNIKTFISKCIPMSSNMYIYIATDKQICFKANVGSLGTIEIHVATV